MFPSAKLPSINPILWITLPSTGRCRTLFTSWSPTLRQMNIRGKIYKKTKNFKGVLRIIDTLHKNFTFAFYSLSFKILELNSNTMLAVRDVPDIRPFFDIRYPAGYRICFAGYLTQLILSMCSRSRQQSAHAQ